MTDQDPTTALPSAPVTSTPSHGTPETRPAPVLSLRRAADLAGVSMSTLRRRRTELEAHGATVSPAGWEVPVTALEAMGLIGPQAAATPSRAAAHELKAPEDDQALVEAVQRAQDAEARVAELEAQLRDARHRATLAEAIAHERLEALNAERMALRMLTTLTPTAAPSPPADEAATPASPAGQSAQERDTATSSSPSSPEQATRPSWWRRTFG